MPRRRWQSFSRPGLTPLWVDLARVLAYEASDGNGTMLRLETNVCVWVGIPPADVAALLENANG